MTTKQTRAQTRRASMITASVELLHNIHGQFRPKTMTALMGSSGAGKSTLLDVLAGRKNAGKIQGLFDRYNFKNHE